MKEGLKGTDTLLQAGEGADMLDPIPHSDTDPFFQIKEVTTLMPEEVESVVIPPRHGIRNNHQE